MTPRMTHLALSALAVGLLLARPVSAQSLSGGYTTISAATGTVDLTTEGSLDWIKFSQGSGNAPVTESKDIPSSLISFTTSETPNTYDDVANSVPTFAWTDGKAPSVAGSDKSEWYLKGDNAFSTLFTSQSSASPTAFHLYTGPYNGSATLTAQLENSQGKVLDTYTSTLTSPTNDNDYVEYSLDYAGAGDTLVTTVTSDNQNGAFHSFNLLAADLGAAPDASAAPEPPQLAALGLTGLGLLGLVLRARRRIVASAS